MTFEEVLQQIQDLLQREQRISYRGLKRRFNLDDEYIQDIKAELIKAKRLAVDEDGEVLVWKDSLASSVQSPAPEGQERASILQTLDSRLSDSRPDAAERRQLTVMFCDLVGSTALSTQLDPEELREVVRTYQETCTEVIRRYDGHIAQHLGDGLLTYFGYPVAHEDDAARAVRAGLEIVEALHQQVPSPLRGEGQGEGALFTPLQNTPHPSPLPQGARGLQVRIGIHTGLVVIGEIGSSEKREMLALGETPNIAARVQGVAEPNTVVMSAVTHLLVQGLFECQDLGPQTLKGIAAPLLLYRVLGESTAQSRFEAAVSAGLTPLVGREEELSILHQRWAQAKDGSGQVVLLSGEPGIGKSRLVQELKEQLTHDGATRVEFRCSPYHQNSALYPIIDHLQRLLRFTREDMPDAKLAKLQHVLVRYRFAQTDTVPLLAALLSLPHPEGYPPITVSPQKQKEKTQAALVAWLVEEAELRPVYTVWEDLHWADPSTLEVLTLLLDQTPTTRLLALLTCRAEFTSPWGLRSYLTQLTLNRLGQPQVEAMVKRVTGSTPLPSKVIQQIVAKTDGVPLFVEELTKTVVEAVRAQHAAPTPLAIPATLQDSLMARLDRIGPAKEIAQLGATIGREFNYEILQAVSPLDEERLQHGLKQLVGAELVYRRGLPPQAHYLFKHALIQDTAYQSLLKSTRQQYHRQIAQVLEGRFRETVETQPELVAQHYTEAGLIEQAIPYWQKAGQGAVRRSANAEAVNHLTRGLNLLETLPDVSERTQLEFGLQTALGPALMATKGFAAPEVVSVYARARALCQQVGEAPQLFSVLLGLANYYNVRGEFQTGRELGEQLLGMAQRLQDPALLLEAHHHLGGGLYFFGELTSARAHLQQALALYDHHQHRSHAFLYGHDPRVCCLCTEAHALWFLGYPDQALKSMQNALTFAQELAHTFSLGQALMLAAGLHALRREVQATHRRAAELIELSREQGFPIWLPLGTAAQGWVLAEQGHVEKGIAKLRQGIDAYRATQAEMGQPDRLRQLAAAYGKAGQAKEGLTVLTEAWEVVSRTGERLGEAELYRIKGELLLTQEGYRLQAVGHRAKTEEEGLRPQAIGLREKTEEAEECFLQAIAIARKQEAKSLELRAATSLARLWQQQGKQKEAHQLLSEIYNWFTEGFDTKDLQDAKALLEELSKPHEI